MTFSLDSEFEFKKYKKKITKIHILIVLVTVLTYFHILNLVLNDYQFKIVFTSALIFTLLLYLFTIFINLKILKNYMKIIK